MDTCKNRFFVQRMLNYEKNLPRKFAVNKINRSFAEEMPQKGLQTIQQLNILTHKP